MAYSTGRYVARVGLLFIWIFTCAFATLTPSDQNIALPQKINSTNIPSDLAKLVYVDQMGHLNIVNSDGSGLHALISDKKVASIEISPDKKFLAVISKANVKGSCQSILTIYHFSDEKVIHSICLNQYYFSGKDKSPNDIQGYEFFELNWSPDGGYLAFTGEIDQPLTTLYVYDVVQNRIKWFSSNTYQAKRLIWSPDSQWLIYSAVNQEGGWYTTALRGITITNNKDYLLYDVTNKTDQMLLGWYSNTEFLVENSSMGGKSNIRTVDLSTGKITSVYPNYYTVIASAEKGGALLFIPLIGPPVSGLKLSLGIYLVSKDVRTPKLIYPENYLKRGYDFYLANFDPKTAMFVTSDLCGLALDKVRSFGIDGKESCVYSDFNEEYSWKKWYINMDGLGLYLDKRDGTVFSNAGKLVGQIPIYGDDEVAVSPDLNGFFVIGKTIRYYSFPDLIEKQIDAGYMDEFPEFFWVNQK
ncbi:MAG: hypothetical protein VB013_08715 [Anaerolineaceae bacterium]|nr:hypothetical protein [Anaerolineaceae bacterium]